VGLSLIGGGLEEVVEEAGDGEGADTADCGGDGGEVGAGADTRLFKNAPLNPCFFRQKSLK